MTNKIVGAQTPDEYTPACAANCNECPFRVDGEDGRTSVCRYWERVSDAIREMFLHVGGSVRGESRCAIIVSGGVRGTILDRAIVVR